MKTSKRSEAPIQIPVQVSASLTSMTWSFLWNTPRSRASIIATRARNPSQKNIIYAPVLVQFFRIGEFAALLMEKDEGAAAVRAEIIGKFLHRLRFIETDFIADVLADDDTEMRRVRNGAADVRGEFLRTVNSRRRDTVVIDVVRVADAHEHREQGIAHHLTGAQVKRIADHEAYRVLLHIADFHREVALGGHFLDFQGRGAARRKGKRKETRAQNEKTFSHLTSP